MRAMDETGKWLPKSRKVYDLDKNGERIRLPSGNWKSHKEDTVDWNDQKLSLIHIYSLYGGIRGQVKMVVMKVHVPLQAARFAKN